MDTIQNVPGIRVDQLSQRTVKCGTPNTSAQFTSNFVKTSKYTAINFLPKNLFEQFRRLSNAWFLVMAGFQMIPEATVSQRVPTILGPLGFVMASTLLREGVEDYLRHKADNEMNSTIAYRLSADGTQFEETSWKDLVVGEVVRLKKDEFVPADMVLLSTNSKEGIAYIQTSNIDGETNLKFRQALEDTWDLIDAKTIAAKLPNTEIHCELPNNSVHTYTGSMVMSPALAAGKKCPLSIKNLLLRGARLQNTEWAIGVIVYTGDDTKVRQNAAETPSKRSQVELRVNKMIAACLILQFSCCILVGILAAVYNDQDSNVWYLDVKGKGLSTGAIGAYAVITAILVLQDVVPIAIFISMDIAKTFQSRLISQDLNMYYADEDAPAIARTSNLNESLGQVQYLFTDKTGTLTCNQMKFKACSVNGILCGMDPAEADSKAPTDGMMCGVNMKYLATAVDFDSARFCAMVESGDIVANEFLRCLAICHTIIPEVEAKSAWGVALRAESPDENALVSFAGALGYRFTGRKGDTVFVEKFPPIYSRRNNSPVPAPVIEQYQVLATIEFTSARKRMSVIVRTAQNQLILYCKGADSILTPLLNSPKSELQTTQAHLDDLGRIGLRTLLLASKSLSEEEFSEWNQKWQVACNAIENRDDQIATIASMIEQNMNLLGATAIEDRLQDHVPETIQKLRDANIAVWMLTGDKLETAIEIGRSCRLLDAEVQPHILTSNDAPTPAPGGNYGDDPKLRHDMETALHAAKSSKSNLSVVVDGPTLTKIMGNSFEDVEGKLVGLAELFFNLTTLCHTVVCCRVSPLQKALVVRLVATHVDAGMTTMAIGDGANDVPMIQSAHVGVGIMGKEGLQAVLSSDYALGQFSYLQDLLLVHGHYSYSRVTTLILYVFYKSLAYALTQFWFNPVCRWTMQPLYNIYTQTLFSVVFSSLPVIFFAFLDRDLDRATLMKTPVIYCQGQMHLLFNMKRFFLFVFSGLSHSVVCTIVPLFLLQSPSSSQGYSIGLRSSGNTSFTVLVFIVNMKMALCSSSFTYPNVIVLVFSVSIFIIWELFLGAVPTIGPDDVGEMVFIMGTGMFYVSVMLAIVIGFFFDYSLTAISRVAFPDPVQIAKEMWAGYGSDRNFQPTGSEMQNFNRGGYISGAYDSSPPRGAGSGMSTQALSGSQPTYVVAPRIEPSLSPKHSSELPAIHSASSYPAPMVEPQVLLPSGPVPTTVYVGDSAFPLPPPPNLDGNSSQFVPAAPISQPGPYPSYSVASPVPAPPPSNNAFISRPVFLDPLSSSSSYTSNYSGPRPTPYPYRDYGDTGIGGASVLLSDSNYGVVDYRTSVPVMAYDAQAC